MVGILRRKSEPPRDGALEYRGARPGAKKKPRDLDGAGLFGHPDGEQTRSTRMSPYFSLFCFVGLIVDGNLDLRMQTVGETGLRAPAV